MKRRFFVTFGKNGFKRRRKMSLRAKWVERAAKTGIMGNTGQQYKDAFKTRSGKRGIRK